MSRVLKNKNNLITQGYTNNHQAVDLVGEGRTLDYIVAHTSGIVNFCQTGQKNNKGSQGNASYGNCVKIKHNGGYETLYAHMASVNARNGQTVSKGQVIGYMGNTGNAYGAHLHFELRKNGIRINPVNYLNTDLPDNSTVSKSIEAIANEVINGKWGNGDARKSALTKAGYNYNEVQARVNQLLSNGSSNKKSVEEIAKEVISGKWGNGQDRKNRLTNAGYNYNDVQKRVNQLLK